MSDLIPRRARRSRALPLLLLLSTLGGGCIPSVKQIGLRDAQVDMPSTFGDDDAAEASDLEVARRTAIFDDPELVALIEEALAHNQELALLQQEIHVASAEIGARKGETLPKLDLAVGAGVEKVGRYTSQGASDVATDIEPGREVPEHLGDFRVAFQASWEIDIWKKLRNATKAARLRYLASIEGRNFAVTGLVAEIASTWYELKALDKQLEVVDTNLEILERSLGVVRLQLEAARVTALAVQRFEAELRKNQSRRFGIQQQVVETQNRLNQLCGRYPQEVVRDASTFIDTPLATMEAGLPSQLLERRPDVRAAELDLEAAELDVKVARARFFPSLTIDATLGIQAFSPEKLAVLPASLIYDVAAGLLAPLLNRSGLKADYLVANAKQMQAVVSYEQTALRAFVEVANLMSLIANVDEAYALKTRQVDQLEHAIETSSLLFRSARADYLEVLTTRRDALEAEIELIETKQRQVGARIQLYRALGGGWPGPDDDTPDTPETAGSRKGSGGGD